MNIPQKTLANGVKVPCIGMGTFGSDRFTPDQVSAAVYGAIKIGYRLFDCASIYGNEDMIGDVFQKAYDNKLVKREDLFIQSKVWNDMHGDGDVLISVAKTLKDLKTDYLDMYFLHWPLPNFHPIGCDVTSRSADAKPFDKDRFMKTWRQMERLVDMGLVKGIGMSNMTIKKLRQVLPECRIKPLMIEMENHPTFQQEELYNYCVANGIQPIAFCPIGSPTRPDRDKTEADLSDIKMPALIEIAKAHNVHPAIICLKWAVQRGQIPIPFSIYSNEYESNLMCVTKDPLTDEEMATLKGLESNNRLIKGQVFLWEGEEDWHAIWDEKE